MAIGSQTLPDDPRSGAARSSNWGSRVTREGSAWELHGAKARAPPLGWSGRRGVPGRGRVQDAGGVGGWGLGARGVPRESEGCVLDS